LEPTLPRIRVWDDNAICSYSGAELGIQNIEFKPMEETLFNKHQMALASIRGFDITGWDQPPIKSTSHAPCNATNNQPEAHHLATHVERGSVGDDFGRSKSIDFESARKVLPGASQLSL